LRQTSWQSFRTKPAAVPKYHREEIIVDKTATSQEKPACVVFGRRCAETPSHVLQVGTTEPADEQLGGGFDSIIHRRQRISAAACLAKAGLSNGYLPWSRGKAPGSVT